MFFVGALLVWSAHAIGGCARTPLARALPAAKREAPIRPPSSPPPLEVSLPDEAVVHVLSRGVGCSGTLISNQLVLTAHHCVVERDASGEILEQDLAPAAIRVELGGDYTPWGTVRVSALLAPPCGYRGGQGDIAILVLTQPIAGGPVMRIRLGEPPAVGESIEPIGFGRCLASDDGVHRTRRIGGPVEQVGPGVLSATASICPGDSGGPAWSNGAAEVVGVVSAAVMDESDRTRDPSTFTRVDVWSPLFEMAELVAMGTEVRRLPPIQGCHR